MARLDPGMTFLTTLAVSAAVTATVWAWTRGLKGWALRTTMPATTLALLGLLTILFAEVHSRRWLWCWLVSWVGLPLSILPWCVSLAYQAREWQGVLWLVRVLTLVAAVCAWIGVAEHMPSV